jgi:hypothetical protein
MKMEPMNAHPDRPDPIECSAALDLAQEAIICRAHALPREAEAHIQGCRNCRAEMDAIGEVDGALSLAFGAVRRRIPGPTPRDIDEILAAARETPPSAILFGRIRRSVRRMLYLTMLVLSFLLVALIAWAMMKLAGG